MAWLQEMRRVTQITHLQLPSLGKASPQNILRGNIQGHHTDPARGAMGNIAHGLKGSFAYRFLASLCIKFSNLFAQRGYTTLILSTRLLVTLLILAPAYRLCLTSDLGMIIMAFGRVSKVEDERFSDNFQSCQKLY